MHSAARKERLSQSPDPASWSLVLAGKNHPCCWLAIFAILQLQLILCPLCFERLPILAFINITRVSDIPIAFPSTEGELRAGIIQAASPKILIDESRSTSSKPSRRVHCRLEVEGLLIVDKFLIYIAKKRATKTHYNIPALRSALVQPNH